MIALCIAVIAQAGRVLLPNDPGGPTLALNLATAELRAGGFTARYRPGDWPNVRFRNSTPEDWSSYGAMSLRVSNPGREAVSFNLRFDDRYDSDGVDHCAYAEGTVPAGKRMVFVARFTQDPMKLGMRALPVVGGEGALTVRGGIDWKQVHQWQLFLSSPSHPVTLAVDDLKLMPAQSVAVSIDRFGQFAGLDWPGKVKTESDLTRAAKTEDLKPLNVETDRYGGWLKAPQQTPTGRFRTQKIGEQWWLVTPEGHLFFSFGMDCVHATEHTIVSGRESMFQWLPKPGEPLARFLGVDDWVLMGPMKGKPAKIVDFVGMNLERKYGGNWKDPFVERSLDRLRSWGFNTVANWSDEAMAHARRVPYVVTTGVGGDFGKVRSGIDYWGAMPDVFDPRFEASVHASLQPKAWSKGDPYCLGWFVDNELSWRGTGEEEGRFGIAYGALKLGPTAPAKLEFVRQLREKYADVNRLNDTWGTRFGSWDHVLQPISFKSEDAKARRADLLAFMTSFCNRYFSLVSKTVHEIDPRALYLGCRLAWATKDTEAAAARYCDVISYNVYAPSLDAKKWDYVRAFNKPCIIGEFHFGATDRGMFHPGLVNAKTQKGRGDMYESYVKSVLAHPSFVGCHWFQYRDEPTTGRSLDGENYNIGFIDVTDVPYPLMVKAARKVHSEALGLRSK